MLYKVDKPVILAVNKIDEGHLISDTQEFYSLGLGEPIVVSGSHGIGIGDLLNKIVESLPDSGEDQLDEDTITFCMVGRPNVGKCSLVNALLNDVNNHFRGR